MRMNAMTNGVDRSITLAKAVMTMAVVITVLFIGHSYLIPYDNNILNGVLWLIRDVLTLVTLLLLIRTFRVAAFGPHRHVVTAALVLSLVPGMAIVNNMVGTVYYLLEAPLPSWLSAYSIVELMRSWLAWQLPLVVLAVGLLVDRSRKVLRNASIFVLMATMLYSAAVLFGVSDHFISTILVPLSFFVFGFSLYRASYSTGADESGETMQAGACPHCGEKAFSSWKIGFSRAGKALVCPSCGKHSYVPYWPVSLMSGILGVYFFAKFVVSDQTAIIFLMGAVLIALPFIYFNASPLIPNEVHQPDSQGSPSE